MNKKGFSLLELLAVIIILSVLFGVAVVGYNSFIKRTNDQVYETYMDDMHEAAIMYFLDARNTLPNNHTTKTLTISDLGIATINNPKNPEDKCVGSHVDAKRNDITDSKGVTAIKIEYTVCLICSEDFNECKTYTN